MVLKQGLWHNMRPKRHNLRRDSAQSERIFHPSICTNEKRQAI